MIHVVWTDPAIADLGAILDYIRRDSPRSAEAIAEELLSSVDRLQSHPRSGRVIPETRRADLRELIVGSFRVMYRVTDVAVEVLTIVHGARRVPRRRLRAPR